MIKKIIASFLVICFFVNCTYSVSFAANSVPVYTGGYEGGLSQSDFFLQSVQQYSNYDYGDPGAMSDEDFFGKWENDKWIKNGVWNYAAFDGLRAVEEYAKAGNYEFCKEELLEYYRNTIPEYKYSVLDVNNIQLNLWAELAMDNFMLNSSTYTVLGKAIMAKQSSEYEIDVLSSVSRIISSTDKKVTYAIVTPKKDGYAAEIDNGENKPYIKAVINNHDTKYFYPVETTSVRAGSVWKDGQGTSDKLYAEESYTSIGNKDTADEYTRRAYMKFDFSELDSGDTVSQAELYLNGRMVKSENPVESGIEKDDKAVYVIDCKNAISSVWTADTLNFGQCFTMFSYYGEKGATLETPVYFQGIYPNSTSQRWASNALMVDTISRLSRLYVSTGEETFAYHATRYLLNIINNLKADFTPFYQDNLYCYGLLGEMEMFMYCLVDSSVMDAEMFTTMMKNIYLMTEFLRTCWVAGDVKSNIGSMCTYTMVLMSLYFPEFTKSSEPVTGILYENIPGSYNGGWLAVARERIKLLLQNTCYSDGGSSEVSLHYIVVNLTPFMSIFSKCDILDRDSHEVFSEDLVEYLENAVVGMVKLMNPQFGTFQQGDESAYDSAEAQNFIKTLVRYLDFDSNEILYAASDRKNGYAPEYTSTVIESTGKAVLRSSWNPDAVSLYINADGGVASHGHRDDLAVSLYAYGKYLLSDSLRYTYSLNPISAWQNSTRAHNTVEINNASQKTFDNGTSYSSRTVESLGEEYRWPSMVREGDMRLGNTHAENRELNSEYDFLRFETYGYTDNDALDDSFKVQRDVLFVRPDFYIVSDYIAPENNETNSYKQTWHYLPDADVRLEENSLVARSHFDSEANIIIAPVDDGSLKSEIKDGVYSYINQNGTYIPAQYLMYSKEAAEATSFNTILYPQKAGDNITLNTENISLNDKYADAFRAVAENKKTGLISNMFYYTVYEDEEIKERTFDSYTVNAGQAYSEKNNGKLKKLILRNGTEFKADGHWLVKSNSKIDDLSVGYENGTVELTSSKEISLDGLTLFKEEKINSVYLNGEKQNFNQTANYIYFGQTPIIDDSPMPNDNGGGSGGISGGGSGGGTNHGSASGGSFVTPSDKPEIPTVPDASKKYPELDGHWGETEIRKMIDSGYVCGYDDGKLHLKDEVTRAEFVTLIARALKYDLTAYTGVFADVSVNDWFSSYIQTVADNGIINGNGNEFMPENSLTRQEMAKILVSIYEKSNVQKPVAEGNVFADNDDISEWAFEYVDKAFRYGLMNGTGDNMFSPNSTVLREQAIVAVYRLLEHLV